MLSKKLILSVIKEELNADNQKYSHLVDRLMDSIETRYDIDIFISYNKFAHTIMLSKIVLEKKDRGKGIGTKVLGEICDFADQNALRIALTPTSDFGGSKTRLIQFYKNFGFKKYKGYEFKETMVRLPN